MTSTNCGPGRVLVVDDQQSMNMLITRCLTGMGIDVTSAFDGLEALRLGKAHEFDLVLLDQWLPGMMGIDVMEAWRTSGINHSVILISALTDQDAILRALQAGATDFIRKPFDLDDLVTRVQKHLTGIAA